MNIYKRLKDTREDFDKSRAEIAKITGTSQSYYAQYKNGKRAIPFERICPQISFNSAFSGCR